MPNKTMEDFWVEMGWYTEVYDRALGRRIRKLTQGKWKDDEQAQQDAVRFLVDKVLRKGPQGVTQEDFRGNRLGGLLTGYYHDSPYKALREACYEINPWEMATTPNNFYNDPENRKSATRWLASKLRGLGIYPRGIQQEDFFRNGLSGLLDVHEGSPYKALYEAELVTKEDETYMKRHRYN